MPRSHRFLPAFLLVFLLTGCPQPPALEPVMLGYLPTAGEPGQRGLQLALREVNESETLVIGRRVVVLTPNLTADSESVQAVATRLATVNKVFALLGGTDAAQADALGRAAQPAGASVVAACSVPVQQLAHNVFPARLAPADQGQLLARHAVEGLQATRVTLLVGTGEPYTDLAAAFVRQFTRDDAARKVDRRTIQEKTTWAELADGVQADTPNALVLAVSLADLARLRDGMGQAGVKTPLLFGTSATEPLLLPQTVESEQPIWGATLYLAESDTNYREFGTNYQKEFGEPASPQARLAYDAGKVMIAALRRSRLVSRDKLREELGKAFVVRLDTDKPGEARSYPLPGR